MTRPTTATKEQLAEAVDELLNMLRVCAAILNENNQVFGAAAVFNKIGETESRIYGPSSRADVTTDEVV